jgi:hypothetical protein
MGGGVGVRERARQHAFMCAMLKWEREAGGGGSAV